MNRSRLLETVVANRCLLLTLVVALVVRLGLAVVVQQRVDRPPAQLCLISGDAEGYWELAQTIVAGTDYAIFQPPRYVLRVPGFPALLALSQMLFGQSPFAARCLLSCVGTIACGLTYWLGRELADETTGLIAAIYTALSPTLSLFSVLILSETAFAAALLVSLIAMSRLTRRVRDGELRQADLRGRGALSSLMTGMLIGGATLVRPTWLYVGLAIASAALLVTSRRGSMRASGLSMAIIVCGVGLALTPWTIRNYFVTGHVIPTTLWVGPSLYDGLNPLASGDSNMEFVKTDQLPQQMSEYDVDREYRRRAWDYALQNPIRVVELALKKQQRYWSLVPNADQFRNRWLHLVVAATSLPLLLCGAWGFWICRCNLRFVVLTAGPVLLFAALHLLFVGSLRYRLPAEYPLSILAVAGLSNLVTRRSRIPVLHAGRSGDGDHSAGAGMKNAT